MSGGDLFSRQRRLREWGEAGQARVAASQAVVRGLAGAEVEAAYLTRAGVGTVVHDPGGTPAAFPHDSFFRFAACRDVGAGAWRALAHLRGVLGAPGP